MLSRCFLDCSVGVGGFCHRKESDLFLFLSNTWMNFSLTLDI